MSNIDYTNSIKNNYNSVIDTKNYKGLAQKIDQYTFWNFTELYDFILHNYKQLFLLLSIFIIIFVIEKIAFYNSFIFTPLSAIPGVSNTNNNVKTEKKGKKGKR
jgi:hypothetical protein